MGSASAETSRSGEALVDVLAEPSRGHCRDGLPRRAHAYFQFRVLRESRSAFQPWRATERNFRFANQRFSMRVSHSFLAHFTRSLAVSTSTTRAPSSTLQFALGTAGD